MAQNGYSGGSQGDDLMSDAPASAEAPASVRDEEENMGEEATLPQSFCPGMEVGDEINAKITAIRDGEYVVKYIKSEEESPAEEAPMSGGGGDEEMRSLMG